MTISADDNVKTVRDVEFWGNPRCGVPKPSAMVEFQLHKPSAMVEFPIKASAMVEFTVRDG